MREILSDRLVRDGVLEALEHDPEVFARHISVISADGAVTLAGHVATFHEKHVAVRAAERVRGVEAVAHLRRGWSSTVPDSVAVQVREGRVYLSGRVASEDQRNEAENAIGQLVGVRQVGNFIRVAPVEQIGKTRRRAAKEGQ